MSCQCCSEACISHVHFVLVWKLELPTLSLSNELSSIWNLKDVSNIKLIGGHTSLFLKINVRAISIMRQCSSWLLLLAVSQRLGCANEKHGQCCYDTLAMCEFQKTSDTTQSLKYAGKKKRNVYKNVDQSEKRNISGCSDPEPGFASLK